METTDRYDATADRFCPYCDRLLYSTVAYKPLTLTNKQAHLKALCCEPENYVDTEGDFGE